jgi:uncharacterized protein with PQ loop repeat
MGWLATPFSPRGRLATPAQPREATPEGHRPPQHCRNPKLRRYEKFIHSSAPGLSPTGREMASWNLVPLEITYRVLGWTAFLSWAMCFYPQVISNFCRKRYYYNTNKFPIFLLGLDFISRYAWLLIMFLGFLCWGVCEPSVVGMSFDFVVLNLTKHSLYLIFFFFFLVQC